MNSEELLKTINSLFTFMINNPLNSSQEILDSNILKKIFDELDEDISKNLKLKYDNNLTSTILNLTEAKTHLLKLLKISKFDPSEQFNEEIEKLDIAKLSNKNQTYLDNFIQLILISTLYCKERKTFTTKLNSENKKVLSTILRKYLKQKPKRDTSKDKMNRTMKVGKSPLKKIEGTNENKEKKSKREKSEDKIINHSNEKHNQTMGKGFQKMKINIDQNEKELRDKLDNEIRISMEKDISKKELDEELKQNIKNEVNLKKELENLNMRSQRNNKLIALLQTNEEIARSKLKSVEEEYKNLSLKFEKILELKSKFNANISDNSTKEFELISGAMYKLGCVFWENKSENYNKKSKDTWLDAIRLRKYNENS